jgi:hypothetical protein
MIKKAGLKIDDMKISSIYAESMMSKIDTMRNISSQLQMKHVEFLVFIARVAHEEYIGTESEKLGLHLKIDMVLKPLLGTIS